MRSRRNDERREANRLAMRREVETALGEPVTDVVLVRPANENNLAVATVMLLVLLSRLAFDRFVDLVGSTLVATAAYSAIFFTITAFIVGVSRRWRVALTQTELVLLSERVLSRKRSQEVNRKAPPGSGRPYPRNLWFEGRPFTVQSEDFARFDAAYAMIAEPSLEASDTPS